MSLCRFSSDDYQSGVYCHEHMGGGWVTHVAARRIVPAEPFPPAAPFDVDHIREYIDRHNAILRIIGRPERVPIGLPYDGQSFDDPDEATARARLRHLADVGYRVPRAALETV